MTYNQIEDAMVAFFDKFDYLIDDAIEGSDIWAIKELEKCYSNSDDDNDKERLLRVMLYLAERVSDSFADQ